MLPLSLSSFLYLSLSKFLSLTKLKNITLLGNLRICRAFQLINQLQSPVNPDKSFDCQSNTHDHQSHRMPSRSCSIRAKKMRQPPDNQQYQRRLVIIRATVAIRGGIGDDRATNQQMIPTKSVPQWIKATDRIPINHLTTRAILPSHRKKVWMNLVINIVKLCD